MRNRNPLLLVMSLALLLLGGSLVAKLLQCPKCGYEYEEGAATCTHCSKELPRVAVAPPPAAPAAPGITGEIMDREIARVQQARQQDRPALVVVRARNALALLKLAPEASRAQTASLVEAITEAERRIREIKEACFACRGSGKRETLFSNFKGEVHKQQSASGTVGCPVCGGAGQLASHALSTVLVSEMAKATQAFEREQQARAWENVGGAWLPAGVFASLSPRQQASVKSVTTAVCPTCFGLSFQGCTTCSGFAKIKCSNAKCVQGQEPCLVCKGTRRATTALSGRSAVRSCTACGQTGVADCSVCGARGYTECIKCQSRGELPCTTCKGNGESPACRKCDGTGLGPCKTCKGAGEIRGSVCLDCKGEKNALCTTCNGSGHRR